ncbi:MAG: hypothetical protein A2X49_08325 [Lentisphaerae bacterium GWF2_52_8]|nr:MAG: hypothetical protein A2X49_08325 [Lentisphaerae bacterium GWF2_52_8]
MNNDDLKKELWEVPDAIRVIAGQSLPMELVEQIRAGRFSHAYWLGRGTSKLAAMWLGMMFFELSDFRVFHLPFSVACRNPGRDLSKVLYIAVSESGSTRELIEAVKLGRERGTYSYCIVNNRKSELARVSDCATCLDLGPGEGFTFKSFSGTILHAAKLANAVGGGREDLSELQTLGNMAEEILKANPLQGLAELLQKAESAFVMGRGILSPLAGNIALKIRELPRIPAEHKSSEEFLHGYGEASARPNCLVIVLAVPGIMLDSQMKTIRYLAARGANAVVLCPESIAGMMPKGIRVLTVAAGASNLFAGVSITVAVYRALCSLVEMLGLDADDDDLVGRIVSPASFMTDFPELQ